jgi:hypothetical protein
MRQNFKLWLALGAALCCPLTVTSKDNEGDKVRVVSLPDQAMVPDAEVDSDGVIHVAYFADDDIYYTKSSDDGKSFSNPLRVNAEAGFASGGAFRGPDIAVGGDGRVHVVWYNAGYQQKRPKEEWGVMYSRLNAGSLVFEKARNLNGKPSDNFSLAADGSGHVAVVWMAGGIFVNSSKDGGKTFAAPVDLKVDPCECCGSRALYAKDGVLSVLYRDKADNIRDTYLAQIPSEGTAVSRNLKISKTPWLITSCPMTGGFLGRSMGGLIAAWETKGQIYFASLGEDAEGASGRGPDEIHASKKGRYPVSLSAPDGKALVAWKDGELLEWQLFDRENQPVGKKGSANSTSKHRPAGVVTKEGKFLLFP